MNFRPWPEALALIPLINPGALTLPEWTQNWYTINNLIKEFNNRQKEKDDEKKKKKRPVGGCFPGTVVSGSGNTYEVAVYHNGLGKPASIVSVRQLQIAGGESIPAGTSVIVSMVYVPLLQSGVLTFVRQYTMQVPVWL